MDYEQMLTDELARIRSGGEDVFFLDWARFWGREFDGPSWLVEPVLPAQRSVAVYAKGGTGKSLFVLWLAAGLATGREMFGHRGDPVSVLYLDFEMTEDDLLERLDDMGYGPDVDMSRLHYALLPSIGPFDTEEGGNAIVARAAAVDADLVVIDTFGRAVSGDENEAKTIHAWYRWTGSRLKAAGRAFVRIDHAGKDLERGQRGTSAKNDDVDVVYELVAMDDGRYRLETRKRRAGWIAESIELERFEDGDGELGYRLLTGGQGFPAGTAACVDLLDRFDIPADWGRRRIRSVLADKGERVGNVMLTAAIRYRKNRALDMPKRVPDTSISDTLNGHIVKPQVKRVPDTFGHGGADVGQVCPPLREADTCPSRALEGVDDLDPGRM